MVRTDIEQRNVVVIAGFQGVDGEGNITTLGRGGSDTTAVAMAAALQADECRIYTDVEVSIRLTKNRSHARRGSRLPWRRCWNYPAWAPRYSRLVGRVRR
ncbi:MAG: hypothetical protein Ct9H300mP14_06950 [Gammaproteobacteria bacterium]|nr:MAG: hypothetical protein Ct9H300mP14_06950 [Gammaproteobacteria bacterium]